MSSSSVKISRALNEIRSGRSIEIDGKSFIHPEYLDAKTFKTLQNARLILTKHRAKAVLNNDTCVEIELKTLTFDDIQLLIAGKSISKKINYEEASHGKLAMELAHLCQLLPVIISFDGKSDISISSEDISNYKDEIDESLEMVTEAPLKLCDAKDARIAGFRSKNGAVEHFAIIIGKINDEPIVRIHSSCYTGDLIGSLACDCGDQLRGAIKLMNDAGGGIILYLMQEGRGIGLINKLRAYKLQAEGLDTVEANEFLGFDDEERSFAPAAVMLKKMGIKQIKLVTNNPKKIKGLEAAGIKVTDRVPLVIRHEHNHTYLEVKSAKSGHII